MQVTYALKTDTVTDENNLRYSVYGITALDSLGNVLETVDGIFFCKQRAEEFIELCNKEKLELIHLPNVIEDIL